MNVEELRQSLFLTLGGFLLRHGRWDLKLSHTTGGPITIVLGSMARVPTLLLTCVMTFTVWPSVKGPRVLPLASSAALWSKPESEMGYQGLKKRLAQPGQREAILAPH